MTPRLSDIIDAIHSYFPDADTGLVEKAYIYSAKVHANQKRLSGEPYLSHPLAVAFILAQLRLDIGSIVAGLLHDTVEDTLTTVAELEEMFGKDVAAIVDGVTKLSKIRFQSRIEKQAENIRKMILAMSKDIRVLLVKLADRLHNMRTLVYQKEAKREMIARETLEIYAPLAARLGIDWVKKELEDLSFMYLYPDEFNKLKTEVERRIGEKRGFVEEVKEIIAKKMAEYGFSCRVLGRPKHLYSIFRKMRLRNVPLDEVYDLIAFRIILKTIQECYEALGLIHSLWRPVPGRFKDYISLPKANMYQSLHTTVIGPGGERMEIQIRTEEMDRVASEGIAAHWLYKEGKIVSKETAGRKFDWLNQLMEWRNELEDPREFLDSVRMDLFPGEVYVFTPGGDVKELPKGATPVDFAYAVHTEIGHHCAGARVNGHMVPLKYELQNGDVVEIITSPQHVPSRDWLKFVKTSRAVARIKQWIKTEEYAKSLAIGRDLCIREFKKNRLDFNEIAKQKGHDIAGWFSCKGFDDLLVAVGYGRVSPVQIVKRYIKEEQPESIGLIEQAGGDGLQKLGGEDLQLGIQIQGLEDIMIHLARCCMPVPGDDVVGYITRGRGITIHRTECPNARNIESERRVDVQWATETSTAYPAKIIVRSVDKKGMLASISNAISAGDANIQDARVITSPMEQVAIFHYIIQVSGLEHLKKIIAGIKKMDGVLQVSRPVS
ncbi:RelA/SpoT family protein [Dissulfurimicrobium hydrothermale]|uniref:RelA/SpoT family protein n=1 Tax=Dissulfurimicrobium hydrothermale TaxID=1750598 RepID=UPI001EDC463B|nr:bifunctional (p)ppGpp synthetase/guanosine-3',5'-bis(diphosphate) 3'-pyrophosphohydrolase [Dissulfurimicrobium hydrothermale]UKL14657.1 bifunctional (p)ppGpp synthetase/guanosine-3',5'-bis(diphosphate) 3'-pyrophosphohydrolase [Dissulfurimicrobium hydrothermale]